MANSIEMPFGWWSGGGPMNDVYLESRFCMGNSKFGKIVWSNVSYRENVSSAVQKRPNWSSCRLGWWGTESDNGTDNHTDKQTDCSIPLCPSTVGQGIINSSHYIPSPTWWLILRVIVFQRPSVKLINTWICQRSLDGDNAQVSNAFNRGQHSTLSLHPNAISGGGHIVSPRDTFCFSHIT